MSYAASEQNENDTSAPMEKSLPKGVLAGLIGGLVATGARALKEKYYPTHVHGEPEPIVAAAENLVGHHLSRSQAAIATETMHWGFGALAGAAYGGIAEYYPAVTAKEGASFGVALAGLSHGQGLAGLGGDNEDHAGEMATDVLYGVITESVRSFVRRFLG